MPMPLRNERGFTLLEALASMVILGFVVVGVMNLSGYTMNANARATSMEEAQQIAEEKLSIVREHIRANDALPAPLVYPIDEYTVTIQADDDLENVTYDASSFAPRHTSLQAHALIGGMPRLVTVTVSWGEPE
ncbi:type IV pilus modification PilV family protein [Paenibacillus sp.]|uniref:type IV pilus modification PilV family protein n=1 Tax=Paenibacillus sp. TaxID=58172 RepID=UPI002D706BAF|nr:prepilin-type N-terminal cleavage/methylation domain-containing protein [Paenibacillus sp.]HZG56046.1 prepilin-type N-terminal cleavage/methylation domain-containing protein [Paenibacillus sp.]